MAIFYFINLIVAAETIQGGNYSREETIRGNTVFLTKNQHTPRKLICFVNRHSAEPSKFGQHLIKQSVLKIEVIKICPYKFCSKIDNFR